VTAVLGREDAPADGAVALLDRPAPPETAAPAPASGSRRLRRTWIIPAAVVVVGALALLPTVGDDGPGPGEAQVAVDGTAEVVRADGDRQVVEDDSVRLGPGDTIEVTAGSLRFELADDVRFEGRTAETVGGRAGTTVRMATVPELMAGPLLVVAPGRTEVRAAGSTVAVGPTGSGVGAARLDRGLGLGVGTYRGRVALDSAGRRAAVPGLHRIEVATPGTFGRRDLPLRYVPDDAWDRRFLGDALALDRQLAPLLAGLDASGPDLATAGGLRQALPDLPSAATLRPLVDSAGSGGEALVLAALSDLDTGGTFAERWAAAERFHGDGAEWGLVALDRRVAPDRLLDVIRDAIDRVALSFDDPGTATGAGDDGSATDDPAVVTPPPGTTVPGGGTAGPTTPGTTAPSTGGGPTDPADPTPPSDGGSGGGSGPGVTVPSTPGVTVPPPPTLPPPVSGPVGGVVDGAGEIVGGVASGVEDILGGVVEGVEGITGGLGVTGSGGLLGPGGLLGGG